MSQSERYRKQNRISRKPKRSLLPGILCALVTLLILMLLWTMPTEDVALQTGLAEDFSQSEVTIEEELAAADEKTTVINSSNSELNTPGVNGVAAEEKAKKKKSKKKSSEEESSSSKKKASKKSKKASEDEGSSSGKGASTGSSGSSKGKSGKSTSTTDADVAASGGGSSTSGDKGSIPSSSGGSSGTMAGTSSGGSDGDTTKKSTNSASSSGSVKVYADNTSGTDETEGAHAAVSVSGGEDDPAGSGVVGASSSVETTGVTASSDEAQADASTDEHDVFDYSGWGFSTYSAFVQEHPIRARLTYARLWTLRFLSTAQPVGCASCSRLDESVPEKVAEVERPQSGQIFEASGQGAMPQLVVVAPEDQDAFVKLKRDNGEVVLSFYVRSGTVVKACVPVGECNFYYALGTDWRGEEELFGSEGVYAKSDRTLNFTTPLNSYEYRFGVENGNVTPKSISMAAF